MILSLKEIALDNFFLVIVGRKEDVLAVFEVLEDGGEVIYPPHSTTYSSCTTNVIDRFGFRWVIMTEQTEH